MTRQKETAGSWEPAAFSIHLELAYIKGVPFRKYWKSRNGHTSAKPSPSPDLCITQSQSPHKIDADTEQIRRGPRHHDHLIHDAISFRRKFRVNSEL
jgi:hypothetical protein